MAGKVWAFCKKEMVLCIATLASVVTAVFVPVNAGYLDYIDFDVLIMLFCLMSVVGGFKRLGAFESLSNALSARVSGVKGISFLMVMLCFVSSMFITNDVALIAFVPLAVSLLNRKPDALIFTVVMQTIAANLGSAVTPIGNPQNLYLFGKYAMSLGDFFSCVLPIGGISLAAIVAILLFQKQDALPPVGRETGKSAPAWGRLALWGVLFAVCVLAVARVLPKVYCLGIVIVGVALLDRRVFLEVDYLLLLTFVMFFVFVGNLSAMPPVADFVRQLLAGRELIASAAISQVISNVPAAVMVSAFTDEARAVVMGTNIGGLGTLIASLASLISFRIYARSEGAKPGKYFAVFSTFNFLLLAALLVIAYFIV